MRTSAGNYQAKPVPQLPSQTGNWMHLTIAPLVAERLESAEPLPGEAHQDLGLGSFEGTTGPAGLADDDLA